MSHGRACLLYNTSSAYMACTTTTKTNNKMKNRFLTILLSATITIAIVSLLSALPYFIPVEYINYGVMVLLVLMLGWIIYQAVDGVFDSHTPTMRSNLDSKEVEPHWEWATVLEELDPVKPEPKKRGRKPKAAAPAKPEPKKRGPKPKK